MNHSIRSILLLESDSEARDELAAAMRKDIGCVVLEAADTAEALDILEHEQVCMLIASPLDEPARQFDLLQTVHRKHSNVLAIAGVTNWDQGTILKVLRMGCFTFLNYPYQVGEAVITAARGLYHYDLLNHKEKRGSKIRKSDGFHGIIGESPQMQKLFRMIERIAEDSSSTVLVKGESGTGKELVARAIHTLSDRKNRNFVPLNCAAIPEELLESELFGYVKGAFTGATSSKQGRIQFAQGGTLFLDEIGDMRPALQAKLLRVLQEKTFEPVGGMKPLPADVRIISATHRDLEAMVAEGDFREDLYYRLKVIPVTIAPLRERKEDIPPLIDKFTQVFNRNRKYQLQGFAASAKAALMEYPWPGNVRELENLVERMVVLQGGKTVALEDLPEPYAPQREKQPQESRDNNFLDLSFDWSRDKVDFKELVSEFENRLIRQALNLSNGNKKEAARLLNMNRTTLLEKIKKKGLDFS